VDNYFLFLFFKYSSCLSFSLVNSNLSANFIPSLIFFSTSIFIFVSILSDTGGNVSISPAVKSLSINQILSFGSHLTKATPPSTVSAEQTASPPSFLGSDNSSIGFFNSIVIFAILKRN
jgi:hypothetical protein